MTVICLPLNTWPSNSHCPSQRCIKIQLMRPSIITFYQLQPSEVLLSSWVDSPRSFTMDTALGMVVPSAPPPVQPLFTLLMLPDIFVSYISIQVLDPGQPTGRCGDHLPPTPKRFGFRVLFTVCLPPDRRCLTPEDVILQSSHAVFHARSLAISNNNKNVFDSLLLRSTSVF